MKVLGPVKVSVIINAHDMQRVVLAKPAANTAQVENYSTQPWV
jgi:hypothetical protein